MKVSNPIAEKLLARIRARAGTPVPVVDLLDLGTRSAVDQALSRLAQQERILRVGRGLYAWPRFSTLLKQNVPPSVDALAHAWARQNGLRIVPFGAYAANLLGLSTQVPAKYVYYTNGRTQRVRLGGAEVRFLNRGPKTMEVKGQLAAHIFQALRYLGKDRMTPDVIAQLRRVTRPQDRADIRRNLKHATAWMKPVLESVLHEDAGHG
jgi:Family of unknown function (DUF6088)